MRTFFLIGALLLVVACNKDDDAGNAQITYVSSNAGTLAFDVKVDNISGQKFLIVVKDETGSTLYRQNA